MAFVHRPVATAHPASDDICIVIQGDRLLAHSAASACVEMPRHAELSGLAGVSTPLMHIGLMEGRPVWLAAVENSEAAPPGGWEWHESRALLSAFTPDQSHAVSCARQLMWWARRHRFCGACGTATIESDEERARRCPKCSAVFFPVVSPAVIVAVTRGDELLLAHNRNFRPGMFSVVAGFVDPGEAVEQAVAREVREEVGVEVMDIQYVSSEPWSYPNSLMLGFRARHASGEIVVDGKEIEQAGWYRRDALPEVPRPGSVARRLIDLWRTKW